MGEINPQIDLVYVCFLQGRVYNPLKNRKFHEVSAGIPCVAWKKPRYGKVRKIEVLFESLKSRGFNFEDVNLKDKEGLKRLLAVITLAFCWAYHVGAWLNEIKPIRIKTHQRPAKSVFRYGFDWIRHLLFNPEDKQHELQQLLTLLRNTFTGTKAHIYQPYPMF
jgi:hypothetical protein